MKWIWITFIVLITDTYSIQTRIQRPVRFIDQKATPTRNFRHIDTSSTTHLDWEHGLREATVQTLYREYAGDHNIRNHIYAAPLLGKQEKATPFGDIAIIARGQLYVNYAGYTFVQDPYQNDCDDCHNIETDAVRGRCISNHCQIWHPRNREQLIALWSIKRIRHRSPRDGLKKLEVEFTISPVGLRYPKQGYLTREGTFNYNLPGHVFILRSTEAHQNLDVLQDENHFKHGALIAQTPDGRKYILHSFPGILSPEIQRYPTSKDSLPTSTTTIAAQYPEDPKKVYQALLEILHKKTSLEPNRFSPPTQKTSTTISDTTVVQFPDGQVAPITELETPFVTKATPGYVTVRFPEVPKSVSPEAPKNPPPAPGYPLFKPSIPSHVTFKTSSIPSTIKYATSPETTLSETQSTRLVPQTTNGAYKSPKDYFTEPATLVPSIPYHSTVQSTTLPPIQEPVKTTFHFFAAEEEKNATSQIPKRRPTTISQPQYTEIDNYLANTVTATHPTNTYPAETTKYEFKTTQEVKETTRYRPTPRIPFTTIGNGRPATVVRVPKPITETAYPLTTFSRAYSTTTEPSTKVIPSISFEPSTTTLYTTKKPYSDFSFPITVLEESSEGITKQETYPTTYAETQTHTNTKQTTATNNGKYATSQFYIPKTTRLTQAQETTTSSTPTVAETRGSTKEAGLETSYPNSEVTRTEKGSIETTLGITKVMGASQNKTTEMVYYAAEETEIPRKDTTLNIPTFSTKPTNTILETKVTNTPKRIVTTISADGRVSVKTTPFYADEEVFGLTKSSPKKYKTTKSYKVSTTEASNFLIENGSQQDYKVPLYQKPLKDYNEEDIFGPTKGTNERVTEITHVARKYTKSDIEQALFDDISRRSKATRSKKSSTTESTPAKVIYSDFFEATTLSMRTQPQTTLPSTDVITPTDTVGVLETTTVMNKESFVSSKRENVATKDTVTENTMPVTRRENVATKNTVTENTMPVTRRENVATKDTVTENTMPVTSQSYLTSISYEVNRVKRPFSQSKESQESSTSSENMEIEKNVMSERMDETRDFKSSVNDNMKGGTVFDNDFVYRLASHAKGIAYLDHLSTTSASTVANTMAKTTKKARYTRRRSYVPRAKQLNRNKGGKKLI